MAKYRQASEKTISRGKGKSTDQLSLADAKEYFNTRAKETGAKKFRWNGEVYDLSGNKVAQGTSRSSGGSSSARSSSAEGPKRPKARPQTGRGDGGAEVVRRAADRALSRVGEGKKPASRSSEANPAVVGAMAAGAVGAGIAAARSSKGPGSGRPQSPAPASRPALAKPATRLALPAPNRGGTVIPQASKPKALPAPKPAAKPRGGGGKAGGANPGRRIRGPGGSNSKGFQLPDILDLKNM